MTRHGCPLLPGRQPAATIGGTTAKEISAIRIHSATITTLAVAAIPEAVVIEAPIERTRCVRQAIDSAQDDLQAAIAAAN